MPARFATAMVLVLGVTVGACASSEDRQVTDGRGIGASQEREAFSAREIEAARKLSLANDADLTKQKGYALELRCYRAATTMEGAVRGMGALRPQQIGQLSQMRNLFAERAQRLGVMEGKDVTVIAKDLESRSVHHSTKDLEGATSTMLACVRRLEKK